MTDHPRTSHITTYGLKPRRRRLICDWLRSNGLDTNRIPEDTDIEIRDGKIITEYLEYPKDIWWPAWRGDLTRVFVHADLIVEPREAWLHD